MRREHLIAASILALWVNVCLTAAPATVRTIYVDADTPGLDDGTSWQNAYRHLHNGLYDAYFGSKPAEVRVAAGVYRPDVGIGRTRGDPNAAFVLITDVTVKGGYAGFGQPDPDQRNVETYRTVLSGDLADNDDPALRPRDLLSSPTRADNSRVVVVAVEVGETAVLDGLTIAGGNDAGTDGLGAGMYCKDASPRAIDCLFTRNAARSWGGGLFLNGSNVTLVNCLFRDNAAGIGGGVFTYVSSPRLERCTFQGGYADRRGGGFASQGKGTPSLVRCSFLQNDANDAGGGIRFYDSGGLAHDCRFIQNTANFGGAVLNERASANFENCRFVDNAARKGGGAIYNKAPAVTVTSSVFERNHSAQSGGAIYNDESRVTVNGCTFVSNTAGLYAGHTTFPGPRIIEHDLDPPLAYVFVGYGPDGGAIYNYDCSPTIANCIFSLNCAQNLGGAVFNYAADDEIPLPGSPGRTIRIPGYSYPILKNCTFSHNAAAWGGEIWNNAVGAKPTLTNCVSWSNLELRSRRTPRAWFRGSTVSYSDIEGGWSGTGNVDEDPLLTPSGHLCADSFCIDKGDPNFTVDPNHPTDVNKEPRVAGAGVDMGADEYIDQDADGLPDWWEIQYLEAGSAEDPDKGPREDTDGDGDLNIDEYELFASNPAGRPLHVDVNAPPTGSDGTLGRPYATLQQALDAAANGDTILIRPGVYRGSGNYNLDLHHKSLILRNGSSEADVILDCNGLGQAIAPLSSAGSNVMLDGLTIQRGFSPTNGTVQLESGRFILRDCQIRDSPAARGGLFSCGFSSLIVAGLEITGPSESVGEPNGGSFSFTNVFVDDLLCLNGACYDVIATRFEGPGSILMGPDTLLRIKNQYAASESTYLRTNVRGPGRIEIEPGQQLTIEGRAVVNLSTTGGGWPDPKRDGHIVIDGSLLVQGDATLESTNIDVRILDVNDPNTIQYNNITLLEASTGFGGELFVRGNAQIRQNRIVSEGDRYLDLDPNPNAASHPLIKNNRIAVVVKEGKLGSQGTLLELRAKDFDAGTPSNPRGSSGAYPVTAGSLGFTPDPSENWVLETLILEANAKLNLTNRQGFRFQDSKEPHPETVYVKELVMGPNAVLNTALQTLYYQRLVDLNGVELVPNPADPYASLANGARFEDVPLLGFSLSIIAMNDPMEFEVRVEKRLREAGSQDPCTAGLIERTSDHPGIPAGYGGVMEMGLETPGKTATTSVAAKGAFARAGDEDITVEFEYLFLKDPYKQAEIIVYLSDHPEVSKNLREIARVRPPQPGRPGSIDSGRFALFSGTFSRGDLNFVRGTYVELELRGGGARCWIDNWDPKIFCVTCGDYDGMGYLDIIDYHLLLAGIGLVCPGSSENRRGCLDVATDGCVTAADLLAWEIVGPLNACPWGSRPASVFDEEAAPLGLASMAVPGNPNDDALGPLWILGKSDRLDRVSEFGAPETVAFGFDPQDSSMKPIAISGTGRLVTDGGGQVYQVHPVRGVIRTDGTVVVAPGELLYQDKRVSVGFCEGKGALMMDAAFHPTDPALVYVMPVRVTPVNGAGSYTAAARLTLTGGGRYLIDALYGRDPKGISAHTMANANATKGFVYEPDLQHLQEIEIDSAGRNLFVLSGCWYNQNNWILVYDAQGPEPNAVPIWLNDPLKGVVNLVGPSAMVASATGEKLYLVSSGLDPNDADDLTKEVYCFSVEKAGARAVGLHFDHTVAVCCPAPDESLYRRLGSLCEGHRSISAFTSLAEDAAAGTLYAVGFTAPRFGKEVRWPATETTFFTTPILAVIGPNDRTAEAVALTGSELALPLSVAYRPTAVGALIGMGVSTGLERLQARP